MLDYLAILTILNLSSDRCKSKCLMYEGASMQASWVTDMCEGFIDIQGIYWDYTETYTAIKMTSFKGSP